jgi:cation transport protein ChaC
MWSIHHRGTPKNPGLVLALDAHPGSFCDGLAFRAEPGTEPATLEYLRERELISSAYLEKDVQVTLHNGGPVRAVTYVVDREHEQYCGGLPLDRQAEVIAGAVGGRGPNPDYLWNTVRHLGELGIEDADLSWLDGKVREMLAR